VTTNIMSGDAEEAQFQQEVAELKQWWTDSRWRFTRRAYTAEQIVSKRGTIKIEYPSNQQSKKLWKLIEGRFKVSSEARHLFLFVGEPVGIGS
jgi:isocitrate lyase